MEPPSHPLAAGASDASFYTPPPSPTPTTYRPHPTPPADGTEPPSGLLDLVATFLPHTLAPPPNYMHGGGHPHTDGGSEDSGVGRNPDGTSGSDTEVEHSWAISASTDGLKKRVNHKCHSDHGRFQGLRKLGSGAFAQIWSATDTTSGDTVAIKDIGLIPSFATEEENEYSIVTGLDHPHIIRVLHRFNRGPKLTYIVFELAETDLFNHLADEEFADDAATCRGYLAEASDALHYLHSKDIVHGDLKLENLLLVKGHVKLCDFGLSGKAHSVRTGIPYGTAEYMPPELLVGQSKTSKHTVTKAQDVWAFGIVMYAVLFADLPWSRADRDDPDFALFAQNGILDHMGPWILLSTPLLSLYKSMLVIHPSRRTTFIDIWGFFHGGQPWLADEEEEEEEGALQGGGGGGDGTGSSTADDGGGASPSPAHDDGGGDGDLV